jgi:hypothetical protein
MRGTLEKASKTVAICTVEPKNCFTSEMSVIQVWWAKRAMTG